ncbi:hypothetical protein [Micromonospora zamorensis]|uniref:Uncharacterized protein n=1 Tax=Micromonospora zamorensis TaxID=709883 RepID=A0ABZ1PN68_9ACTN
MRQRHQAHRLTEISQRYANLGLALPPDLATRLGRLVAPYALDDLDRQGSAEGLVGPWLSTRTNHRFESDDAVRVVRGGDEIPTSTKVSALVPGTFSDQPALYDLLSGVAHARSWGLSDSRTLHGRQSGWSAYVVEVSNSVLIGLLAAQRASAMFSTYRGFQADPGVQAMQQRHAGFDRDLVQYGRSANLLNRLRSVAGFLAG